MDWHQFFLRAYMSISRRLPPSFAWRIYHGLNLEKQRFPFVNAPARFGSAVIRSDGADILDHHYAFHGCSEWPGLMIARLLLAKGDRVFELGANLGTETLNLAAIVGSNGSVVAVEPNPECLERLIERVAENELQQVSVVHAAVDQSEGHVILRPGPGINSGMTYVVWAQPGSSEIQVPATTIDRLSEVFGAPSFIWLDVEGYELNALRGGKDVLSTRRPAIFSEINRSHLERAGGSLEGLVSLFRNLRYVFFDASDWRLGSIDVDAITGSAYHANWLIMPEEKARLVRRIRPLFMACRFLPLI